MNERGNEAAQESQYIEAERAEMEAELMHDDSPESLPGAHYEVFVGTVKVINVCDLLDVVLPDWTGRDENGAARYSRAGEAVMAWVNAHGAHYYSADREDFSMVKAAFEAERAGKRVVVVEDLS
jgi:hypothetical protein